MHFKSDKKRAQKMSTNSILSRTTLQAQNKSFCLTYFLSNMVHRSYLRQNPEVTREFRDVPRKKKDISLTGLSKRTGNFTLKR